MEMEKVVMAKTMNFSNDVISLSAHICESMGRSTRGEGIKTPTFIIQAEIKCQLFRVTYMEKICDMSL